MTKINMSDLINIGDLMYFDGPLMSLFMTKNKAHFYIFDWVNSNEQFNQWIAYQVPLSQVSKFMDGTLSHRDLMRYSLHNEFTLIDIDDDLNYYQRIPLTFEALPISYLPKENTYFSIKNCPDFNALQTLISAVSSKNKLKELEPIA
jgi:hypothetical protein